MLNHLLAQNPIVRGIYLREIAGNDQIQHHQLRQLDSGFIQLVIVKKAPEDLFFTVDIREYSAEGRMTSVQAQYLETVREINYVLRNYDPTLELLPVSATAILPPTAWVDLRMSA